MSKKQILALDCDNVMFAWASGFIGYVIPKGYILDINADFNTYSMHTYFHNMSEMEFKDLVLEYNSHEHPLLFPKVFDTINNLKEKYEVCVITSYTDCPVTSQRRKNILMAMDITNIFMLGMAESKYDTLVEVGADVFVDDSVKHLHEGLKAGCKTYAIKYKYNTGIEGIHYIKSLEGLLLDE